MGVVGKRLAGLFENCVTLDIAGEPDIRADLLDYPELPDCDVIVMLANPAKSPTVPFEKQQVSLHVAEFVVLHAISKGIPVVFTSSVWAQRHPLNAYGCMKRCVEQMVDSHGGASVRIGWIGHTPEMVAHADAFNRGVVWSDERLCDAIRDAVSDVLTRNEASAASEALRSACAAKIEEWRT